MNKLTHEQEQAIMTYLGQIYRKASTILKLYDENGSCRRGDAAYDNQYELVEIIDGVLKACSPSSQLIIENEYLKNHEPKWFISYYAESTYYRYRSAAVNEFLNLYMSL